MAAVTTCPQPHGFRIETPTGRVLHAGEDFDQAVGVLARIDLDTGPEAYAVAVYDDAGYCIAASQAVEIEAQRVADRYADALDDWLAGYAEPDEQDEPLTFADKRDGI